jgi:dTDP-4-amino-4,6-dideoxygalactose transaminase
MAYRHLGYGPGDFPITETLSEQILSLPIGPHLAIPQARKVVEAANSTSFI